MSPDPVVHVACNIDNNYVKYCAVMLTSLLENNKDVEIHVHVIADGLAEDGKTVITDIVSGRYGRRVSFYFPGKEILKECRVADGSYISLTTYYRIFLGRILPEEVKKVLYLDCDIIVNGSVKELWDTDISDVSLGCVEDMFCALPGNYERLHYSPEFSYFNAGVLLINLERLRRADFDAAAVDYLGKHVMEFTMYDQDLLNAMLHADKRLLPFRWNVQDGFLRRRRTERVWGDSLKLLEKELDHTVIIHYTGSKKPWHYKSQHPWRHLYFHYLDLTPWRGERPEMPLGYRLKLLADKVLRACGLMKVKYLKLPAICAPR